MNDSHRIERFFSRIGKWTLGFLVLLCVLELTTRTVENILMGTPFWGGPTSSALYAPHPNLHWVPKANTDLFGFKVNEHGFRGPSFDIPKPVNVFRVLVLGGSAVWDPDISEYENTWVGTLGRLLNDELEKRGVTNQKIEVINGGVPGYNSADSVINYITRGTYIEPDLVIVYQGYNDFKVNWPRDEEPFKPDYSHSRKGGQTISKALRRNIRIVFYMHQLKSLISRRFTDSRDDVNPQGIEAFKHHLEQIIYLTESRDRKILLSTYAMLISEENFARYGEALGSLARYLPIFTKKGALNAHQSYNQAVLDLSQKHQIPAALVDETVTKDLDHFNDHCHLLEKGAEQVAQTFYKTIVEKKLIPQLSATTVLQENE